MKYQKQSGFAGIILILVVLVLSAIGYGGWYVWKNQSLQKQAQRAAAKSTNPYADWKLFKNSGDEFQLYYPHDWEVKYTGSRIDAKGYGSLLQQYEIGPVGTPSRIRVAEYYVYPNTSDRVVLSHTRRDTQLESTNSLIIGGIAVAHDISKDAYGEYEDYNYWHNSIQLTLSLDLQSFHQPQFIKIGDDKQFSPDLARVAKSVCFADMYKTGRCVTNK